MSELKPCPFCNAKPMLYDLLDTHGGFSIECPTDGCDTDKMRRTKAEAIEAWNRRAQPAQAEARPCHVFNVTKNGALTEWEPTTMAFALPDGKHALYTAPQQAEAVPVAVLHRGGGGAFRVSVGENLLAVYALPPGDHDLFTRPQQAEAVPPDHPLYVFATEVIHGAYRYTELPAKAKAAIAAASAQQKGQP